MKLDYFIARRLHFSPDANRPKVSRPAVRVAMWGMGIGLAVMLITICVVVGFKREVRNKAIGFGAHIQVVNFDNNNTYEMQPIRANDSLVQKIAGLDGVRSVQRFATKPGIIKTETDFQGIILKGVDAQFDWNFFSRNLEEGSLPDLSDSVPSSQVLISSHTAKLMGLKLNDTFFCYFIQENVRARKFRICGIYNTDFADYDKLFIIGDLRQVQHLNGWDDGQYSGLEVLIDDFSHLDRVGDEVYFATANKFDATGKSYYTQTIKQMNPQLFAWLDLLDMNVWVIIVLMLLVAGFNIISGLIILILDGVQLIGTLKALGAENWLVRKIFLWQAAFLVGKGMFWGNVVGLLLCAAQYWLHIVPLDPAAYYVSSVPIAFNWLYWLLLNVGTLLASMLMLLGPSYLIAKISPAKVMRYE